MTRSGLDETAYSITSSARARIDGGMLRPSAFAVLRLMTNSNVVGCSTGLVTLLNEERKKAACRKSSSDRSAPGVHRRGAEAAVRRR